MLTKRVSTVVDTARDIQVECSVCHRLVSKSDLVPQSALTGEIRYVCTACYAEKN